ncbi:MAG: hypothetical protein JOZ93_18750 [Sinobacteraceae bacterium]|nr:hypothetical protein [Nevskiaceae bacterium]MBV9914623.1 hypothetical protein [Nevskiaceae bacterium]
MPELRWTLLIIGVVFVAVLAWWERRKPHQAARDAGQVRPSLTEPTWGAEPEPPAPRVFREPTLSLPEIRPREPVAAREVPVLEITDDSLIGLRVDGDPVEQQVAADEASAAEPVAEAIVPIAPEPAPAAVVVEPPPEPPEGMESEPIVDWPPEDSRKLLGLRLVAPQPERLAGRAVRQALAAEGFMLGKYGIFHKPDAANRAVLSAASLTKPGTFDLETMDSQRFIGLNLFAVLPGPKSPLKAFDELLVTARALNERLEGALQDDRGGPLTPTRAAALRSALEAEARS